MGTMIFRKDVISELVDKHGVNRGTANVQYGVVFGTTPRKPKVEADGVERRSSSAAIRSRPLDLGLDLELTSA